MTEEQLRYAAQSLLAQPIIVDIFDDLERQAVDTCIDADPLAHEQRAWAACEVRIIRALRRKLEGYALEPANPRKGAAA